MRTKKTAKKQTQFRQGDVLIERIETPVSTNPKEPENGRVILAHGEVTGHAHEISDPQLATLHEVNEAMRLLGDLDGAEKMTNAALVLTKDATLVHQEHATIKLPAGNFIIRRQREYSPEEIRNVAD